MSKKLPFDNDKYLAIQKENILKRIKLFGGHLYLEFGGKLFDDYHASRVLPGFKPDSKLQLLLSLKDQAEISPVVQFQERILCGLDDLTDQLLFCGQQRLPLFELGTRLRMSADCRYLRLRVRLDLCHLFFSLCFCRRQDLGRFFFRRSLGFLGVGFGVVNDLGDDFL